MTTLNVSRTVVFCFLLVCSAHRLAAAEADEASRFLPVTTVIYAEIRAPGQVLDSLYGHQLMDRLFSMDQVKAAMEQKPYLDFKAGLAIVESQMGLPWRKIVNQVIGNSVTIGVDGATKGVVILARGTDKASQAKLLETLSNLASMDAKNKGRENPIQVDDYRGIKVYTSDKNRFGVFGDWLVIANNDELGMHVADQLLANTGKSLGEDANFAKAARVRSDSRMAWAYVNTAALRDVRLAKKLFGGQAENPLAELFFGGILATLQHTPYVTATIEGDKDSIRILASTPYDHEWVKESREFYFGPGGSGVAPPELLVDDAILTLGSYRDVSGMWVRAGDLFNEQMNEELAKADSGLTTLFGGKDFGEDILGALRPQVQLVVARQKFDAAKSIPAIKLPAFGLVGQLKDPGKMQPELRRTFQSLIGFLNIVGAQNGQPQLDLDQEKSDAAQFVTASYIKELDNQAGLGAKINYNFSPSIAFVGDRLIVSSTTALAHELVAAKPDESRTLVSGQTLNTSGSLRFAPLGESLADNRVQLVSQNMLKEGHSEDEAERDVSALLQVVSWFNDLHFNLATTNDELQILVNLNLVPAK